MTALLKEPEMPAGNDPWKDIRRDADDTVTLQLETVIGTLYDMLEALREGVEARY